MKTCILHHGTCWVAAATALILEGCVGRHAVVAVSGTVIGVEISQNPQTQMYQAKLGYNRGEIAVVPSNRSAKEEPGDVGGGAKDTTDVLMELKYHGLFSSTGGIYQRLAVGKTAVSQKGAAYMFAKDDSGGLDDAKIKAINAGLNTIPETPETIANAKAPLAAAFTQLAATKGDQFNAAAKTQGYADFRTFLLDKPSAPTIEQVQDIRTELEKDAVIKAKLTEIEANRPH